MASHYAFGISHVGTKSSTSTGFAGTALRGKFEPGAKPHSPLPADNLVTGRSGLLPLDFHFVDYLPDVWNASGDLFDGGATALRTGVTL
jgi:hypothetical protein